MEQILTFFFEYKEAIFIIALSIFVGIEVISNVPAVLHTPLMSGANAISGVIIIGGIILVGHADFSTFSVNLILGILGLFLKSSSTPCTQNKCLTMYLQFKTIFITKFCS